MNQHDAPADDPSESQLADLIGAAAAVAVPDAARAAVAGADRPGAPQAGELWRARHPDGGPVTLIWLRSLGPAGAAVVPVSFDVEQADEDTLIVAPEQSPLGLALALHLSAETVIDPRGLLDRLGRLDVAPEGAAAGEWWPVDTPSGWAQVLKAVHQALGDSHPGARISPRPPATAASESLSAVALVAELDAFVLVASVDRPLGDDEKLEAARQALHADQLLNAVCLVEPAAPYLAAVVDRRDVVAAIETPSGRLRPPRQSRPPAPVGAALSKFLDATISPFGRLARTFVEGQAPDPRALAVDVSADAVRTIEASAKSFKTEGKRPGYERVRRHQPSITRLVEEALNRADVDVAALLEDESPEGGS
jgi:hypothetical protein